MIIGLTIHDNDFQYVLAEFAERLGQGIFVMEKPPADVPGNEGERTEWYSWERRTSAECRDLVQLPSRSDEQKKFLADVVGRSWRAFVSGCDDAEYLADRLEITIPETISAEWRNGEQFYVFPTSSRERVLCF